ncbi:MAG: hypothetical protein FWB76_02680 [Oscillospiraceae bacterium]|nr:hypothetical protein [Oscillospiraceae bacterium]
MVKSSVVWLFAGMILLTFNFHINYVHLIPDPLGWALIAYGLHRMAAQSKLFRTGRLLALALILLTSVEWVFLAMHAPFHFYLPLSPFALVLGVAVEYCIIFGVGQLLRRAQRPQLEAWCRPLFACMAVARVLGFMQMLMGLFVPFVWILTIPTIVFGLVVRVVFLVFLRRAQRALDGATMNL